MLHEGAGVFVVHPAQMVRGHRDVVRHDVRQSDVFRGYVSFYQGFTSFVVLWLCCVVVGWLVGLAVREYQFVDPAAQVLESSRDFHLAGLVYHAWPVHVLQDARADVFETRFELGL